MCIFVGETKVTNTCILIGTMEGGDRQFVVYKNNSETDKANAMILPFPIDGVKSKGAIKFYNFENYPKIFDKLDELFPMYSLTRSYGINKSMIKSHNAIIKVGGYDVSVAYSIKEVKALRTYFKLPKNVEELLESSYGKNFGFVICRFDPKTPTKKHPISYSYLIGKDSGLHIPTMHEHGDGNAYWDHKIYVLTKSLTPMDTFTDKVLYNYTSIRSYNEELKESGEDKYYYFEVARRSASILKKMPMKVDAPDDIKQLGLKGKIPNGDLVIKA